MKNSLKRIICCVLIATIIFPVFALSLTVSANTINDPSVIPTPKYKYNVITRRNVDLGGSRSNTVDERFFIWSEYQMAFHDFIMNPFDISKADYLEFDIYSDVATSLQISVGSQSTTRNPIYNNYFEFYDIRSNKKTITLKTGWNHIVIDTKNEFLVQSADTTYPGTYDYHAVDGIILHGPNSNYIRLTNIAFTSIKEVKPNNDNVANDEIVHDNKENINSDILNQDNFDELNKELEELEDLNNLKKLLVLLIRIIFIIDDSYLDSGDINSDSSVDMVDIIIIKNKILNN